MANQTNLQENTESKEPYLGKSVAKSAAWTGGATIGRQVMQVVMVATVARYVSVADYGLMNMVLTVTNFLLMFRDLGTGPALIQRKELSDSLVTSVFVLNVAMGVFLTIFTALLGGPAAWYYSQPAVIPLIQFSAFSFLISSLSVVPMCLLQRDMRFREIAIADLGGFLVGAITAVVLAVTGHGVWSLAWYGIVSTAANTAFMWLFRRWWPSGQWSVAEVKSLMGYSLNLLGFTSVNYWSRNADSLIVGRVLGSVALGLYGQSYNLMMVPLQNVTNTVARVLFPALSQIQTDNARFRSAFLRATGVVGMLTFPLMLGLMAVARPFVLTLLGAKWGAMIPVLLILCPVGLIQSVSSMAGIIYIARARTDLMLRWALFMVACLVPSFWIGTRWGVEGVASAYAIVNVLTLFVTCKIPFRLIDLGFLDFLRLHWPTLQCSLLMMAVTFGWERLLISAGIQSPLVLLASGVAVGIAAYLGAIWLRRPPLVYDLAELLTDSGHAKAAAIVRRLVPSRRAEPAASPA